MDINISRFFQSAGDFDASDFSRSAAEYGADAGPSSWRNAVEYGAENPLLSTPEELDALRDHMRGYGAWDEEEINAWTDDECNALMVQLVSGDMRESGLDMLANDDSDEDADIWAEYEEGAQEGQHSGNIYKVADGRVYYSLER